MVDSVTLLRRLQRSLEFCIGMQGRRRGVTRLGYMKVEVGQDAIITGAAGGIGRALAAALASRGVEVTEQDLKTANG